MFRTANDLIIDESNLSSSDVVSEVVDLANLYGVSIHVVSTGTISGSVTIEVSNDNENWVALAAPSVAVSNTTNSVGQTAELFYKWARISYNATSGTTNTLKVHFAAKGM